MYCDFAFVNNMDKEYSSVLEMVKDESYLICVKSAGAELRVEDDGYCEDFQLSQSKRTDV
jgi:hypothetical protein